MLTTFYCTVIRISDSYLYYSMAHIRNNRRYRKKHRLYKDNKLQENNLCLKIFIKKNVSRLDITMYDLRMTCKCQWIWIWMYLLENKSKDIKFIIMRKRLTVLMQIRQSFCWTQCNLHPGSPVYRRFLLPCIICLW